MSESGMANGTKVLVGDLNWRKGALRPILAALLFGRRERFDHHGIICTLAWWQEKPYLFRVREART
ncbi:hypothetical protein [Antarcticimicrobium sediminis]|uniref:Uncharacterized protein n=1 Tax=Antarcticimicrobium sediminis TaxID=2546227 RepID=A0A4R5F0R5_9RHOB|nr:hypothetical protein [Antarcticimicrobium sediminis]TDE40939.1 hypothetical protein E1B25_01625 [Antarcticimicrobium sediminis]